ncbi:MAG: ABC transporter permease [Flavobacteriales bacterium]|nr:ABC transporter permease [Flavobacteriales bacterium]
MSKIGLIIGREYSSRVKKKSFIIMTILVPLLAAGFLIGAIILGMPEDKNMRVLVMDETNVAINDIYLKQYQNKEIPPTKGSLISDPEEMLNTKYKFIPHSAVIKDSTLTFEQVKDLFETDESLKDYDLLLHVPTSHDGSKSKLFNNLKVIYKEIPSSVVQTQMTQLVNNSVEKAKLISLADSCLDESTYETIKSRIGLNFVDVKSTDDEKDSFLELKAGIGFALGLMIYIFIFIYGVQVMKGVIEEKTNRIVEVIVSSVKPFELMMGKIVGIMLVGLTQFVMWVFLIGIFSTLVLPFVLPDQYSAAFQASDQIGQMTPEVASQMGLDQALTMQDNPMIDFLFNQVPWTALIFIFLFFFIGGYLLYGSLMAAIGAAVDSETDTQQFMLPVSMPLMFAYIISIMGMQDPNSTVMQWCSQIPFTSPVVMLVRYSAVGGDGMLWPLLSSMLLLIIAFIGTTWIAGKIYRTGILMYGKKITYKELFKWLKY